MEHHLEATPSAAVSSEAFADLGRVTITATLEPGQRLRLAKFVAYGWSAVRSQPAIADQVAAALTTAVHTGWEGLGAEHGRLPGRFGDAPMWRSAVTSGCSRRCGSVCSTSCRPARGPRGGAVATKGLVGPG